MILGFIPVIKLYDIRALELMEELNLVKNLTRSIHYSDYQILVNGGLEAYFIHSRLCGRFHCHICDGMLLSGFVY